MTQAVDETTKATLPDKLIVPVAKLPTEDDGALSPGSWQYAGNGTFAWCVGDQYKVKNDPKDLVIDPVTMNADGTYVGDALTKITVSSDLKIPSQSIIPPKDLDQYFGPWCIEPMRFQDYVNHLDRIDFSAHVADSPDRQADTSFERVADGNIAMITIRGAMTKRGSSLSEDGSTILARRRIRLAAEDKTVRSILLFVESPGGTAAGTKELSDEVRRAASMKPVTVFIEDIGASAAFFAVAHATEIFANKPAMIGSIGTFMVVQDSSEMAANIGIKVHLIKAGELKGAGTAGVEITKAQVARFQKLINQVNDEFLAAVKTGRGFTDPQLEAVSDGGVFIAGDALKLGLIDGVKTFDEVVSHMKEAIQMTDQPTAASLSELKSALVGASSDFILGVLERGATLQDAQESWILELSEKATRQAEETKRMQDAAAKKHSTGVDPLGEEEGARTADCNGSAADEWNEKLEQKVKRGMSRQKASSQVNRENPGLRQQFIAEYNEAHGA